MIGQLLDRNESGGERGRWDRGMVWEAGLKLGTPEDMYWQKLTDNQSEGSWAGIYPARVVCFWAWQCLKKPMELDSHRDRQPEWGALGQTQLHQGDVSLGLATLEKTLELSSHHDRQPERGALGWSLPHQGGVYLGLAMLEKPLWAPLFKPSKPKSTKIHVW